MDEKDPTKREFVIENLQRGSVINHNSFLLDDDMDTDARVVTNSSVYYLTIDILKNLRQKYPELDKALDTVESYLVAKNRREPAIDYIINDPTGDEHFIRLKSNGGELHDYKKE